MNTSRCILFAIQLLLATPFALCAEKELVGQDLAPRETLPPLSYDGISLDEWLRRIAQPPAIWKLSDQMSNLDLPATQEKAQALTVVRNMGTNIIPHLTNLFVQKQVATTLAGFEALGPLGKPALPFLLNNIHEHSLGRGNFALNAIGKIGVQARAAIPPVKARFLEGNPIAGVTLAEIGYSDPHTISQYIRILRSEQHRWVKQETVIALKKIGKPAAAAVDVLLEAVKQERGGVDEQIFQLHAMEALGAIGDERVVAPILEILERHLDAGNIQDRGYRRSAMKALRGLGPHAAAAKPILRRFIEQPNIKLEDRALASEALAAISGQKL